MRGSDNFQEMLLISGMRDDANATGFKIKRNLFIFLMDFIHLHVEDKPFSLIRFDGVLLMTAKVDTFQNLSGDSYKSSGVPCWAMTASFMTMI